MGGSKDSNATPARAKRPARASVAKKRTASPSTSGAQPFPIAGVGASAGGLDAFKKLFSTIPADCGIAFVLIQHLDPTRKSLAAELVGTYTTMGVLQAKHGTRVEPNRVYVIPPNKYLSIHKGALQLSTPTQPRNLRMAVDHFLRSLAEDQRERAIGVVLSGTGTDGTLGLLEVKAAGGMTMVQDPPTAQHDGMPRSAIASGCADVVVPAEQMADALLAYVGNGPLVESDVNELVDESDSLSSTVALLHASTDFDFGGYRKGTLRRRIKRRMGLRRIAEMSAYVELLRGDPGEVSALFKDLLLKVTSFFREPAAWQCLREQVIHPMVARMNGDGVLRTWVPACATGEEAYSLAMLLIEEMELAGKSDRLQVFASDADAEALDVARAGVYPETIAADVSPERLARFFTKNEHRYQVNKEVRDAVVFARQNLVADPPFSRIDLITCRNLLIYLEPALQERLIALLHFALAEGGCLFLGSAEGLGRQADLFEIISKKWRIYRRVGPTRHDRVQFPTAAAPPGSIVTGRRPALQGVDRLPALAQKLLLERYAPACVIINRSCEIVYFHGRTDDFLVQPTGPPTKDVIAQARNGLRAKLRAAVRESMRTGQRVVRPGVHVHRGGVYPRVTISVEPFDAAYDVQGLWVISFEDDPVTVPAASNTSSGDGADIVGADHGILTELEYELRSTKEDLQQTIEEFKATNEELMSVNEELQSSNEELETSKEELQSLNEELSTSNTQLEGKIGELEAANDDLDNLLTSTSIATVFLDTSFRIRRFTPAATELFSVVASDIGRPITDIAHKFTDPDLLSDAAAVLERPIAPKREVQARDGRWYVRQVLPYCTHDGLTEGVVITLSDVAAEALLEARLYAEAIVDTVREPLLVLDEDLRVVSANRAFYSEFHVAEKETVGRPLYELGNHEWDIPHLRTLLAEVLLHKRVVSDFEVSHEFRALGPRIMLLNARALVRGGDRPDLILLAIEDLTERRQIQEVLRESEARKRIEEQVRRRQVQLAHALRISTVGELASGLAHEINQPLSTIANDVEACARFIRSGNADSEKLLALLDEASAAALRAGDIVEHLRHFIRKGEPRFELADLAEIVGHVPRVLGYEIEREHIALRLDLRAQSLPIYADRIQIEQVVVNLTQNAIDSVRAAGGENREIDLAARVVGGMAEVAVRDNGVGVSADAADRLFEPFFTTKPEGLGLGLAISRSIIEAHRGRIWAERPVDGGAGMTVRFTVPLHAPAPARRQGSK